MKDVKKNIVLAELIQKELDGCLTDREFNLLQSMLKEDKKAVYYYVNTIRAISAFSANSIVPSLESVEERKFQVEPFQSGIWRALAEAEKAAPAIEQSKNEQQPEQIQKVIYPKREKRIINKFNIITLAMNVAAILFIALFVRFMPVRGKSYACVIGQYQSQLQGTKSNFQVGQYLDDKLVKLEKGLLKIQMNNGSEVLFEAPAEFSLEDDDQLFLIQGKLTASVPKEAVGFTVRTPSASIIDYGTEFGVKVDRYARTEAHVLKGNVKVGVGSNPRILQETLCLSANQAACVSGQTLKEIPSGTGQFVYDIPSSFELAAKSLGASMYLHLQSDNIRSVKDVMRDAATDIEINPKLSVVPGPFSNDGVKSYAFRIEGSDSAIKITDARLIPQNPEGDYSFGCWIRFDEIKQQIICSWLMNTQETGSRLRSLSIKEDGTLRHISSDLTLSNTSWRILSPQPLHSGQWYFVVITRDAGDTNTKYMYIDGKRVAENVIEGKGRVVIEQFDSFQIGGKIESYNGFNGDISEILLFPKSLSSKEVERLYEAAVGNF